MKALLTALLLITGIASQAQTHFKTDSVYLSGKIINAAKHLDSAGVVAVSFTDLALNKEFTYHSKIKPDGSFRLAFIKTGPQCIHFDYNTEESNLLVMPGAHLQVYFDADNYERTLNFGGDNARANRDLQAYEQALDKHNQTIYGTGKYARVKKLMAAQKHQKPTQYRQYLAASYRQDSLFLQSYLGKHRPTPLFKQWATASLQCEYWVDILRYTWIYPSQNQLDEASLILPENYFNFLRNPLVNNPKLAISEYYGQLAFQYGYYLSRKCQTKDTTAATEMRTFLNLPAGLLKEAALCNLFLSKIKDKKVGDLTAYIGQFKKAVTDYALKTSVLNAYRSALSHDAFAPSAGNRKVTDADKVFAGIISKYAGKVVYVDFWSTSCGPCLEEMPNSKKLTNKYAGKDIVFLYLASNSAEKDWKAMIAEKDIKGENRLLTKSEYLAVAEKFQMSGIPRYVLIDKTGRVADDNARRPSDRLLPGDIDKLLENKAD